MQTIIVISGSTPKELPIIVPHLEDTAYYLNKVALIPGMTLNTLG
jgi:hypothetical protein